MSPTRFRRKHGSSSRLRQRIPINIRLGYRPPYDWNSLVAYLGYRAIPGVECIHEDSYSRTIMLGLVKGVLYLRNNASASSISAQFELDGPVALAPAVCKVRDIADMDCRPEALFDTLGHDPVIGPLIANSKGVRVPGCWDVFELILRAIFGQQISVSAATTMLGRLASRFGSPLEAVNQANKLQFVFPTPQQVIGQDLRSVGLTESRSQTVLKIAEAFAEDTNFIHPAQPLDVALKRLKNIKGIGDWTAQYVALRALRSPDAFPAADLGLLKAARVDNAGELARLADAWRPWRGYAALLLWHSLANGSQP